MGPCGPCSELYFDREKSTGCGSESCGVGCDCDRYVEFWNLVFNPSSIPTAARNYTPLEHPNIDNGHRALSAWPASCRGWTNPLRGGHWSGAIIVSTSAASRGRLTNPKRPR
jgi:hypothetical protein